MIQTIPTLHSTRNEGTSAVGRDPEVPGTYSSIGFIQSLVNFTGGIRFRSVEIGDARGIPLQMIIDA